MSKDATQTGVSEVVDADKVVEEVKIHPRMQAMREIADRSLVGRAEEMGVDVDTLRSPAEQSDEEKQAAEKAAADQAAADQVDASIITEAPITAKTMQDGFTTLSDDQLNNTKIKIKVDGKEQEVLLRDLVPKIQKETAVELRLEQSAIALRAAEKAKADAEQKLAEASTAAEKKAAEKNITETSQELTDLQDKYFTAVATGDTKAGADLFASAVTKAVDLALKGRQPATPENKDLVADITSQVTQQITRESALKRFETDYGFLTKDEDLFEATRRRAHQYQNDGLTVDESLTKAGDEVCKKFSIGKYKSRPPTTVDTTVRDKKLADKERLDDVTSANVSSAGIQQLPKTASERIAEMAKMRAGSS